MSLLPAQAPDKNLSFPRKRGATATMYRLQNEEGQLHPSSGPSNPRVLEWKRIPVRNISSSPTRSPRQGQGQCPCTPPPHTNTSVTGRAHCPAQQICLCSGNVSQNHTLHISLLKQGYWEDGESNCWFIPLGTFSKLT